MAEYDAGAAFVSILPSTRGFAQRLKRDISGVNADVTVPVRPELDRRQMSGLQAALKALPAVVLDADATPADRELAGLRGRLEALSDKTVGIDVSAADAKREVDSVRSDLERLSRQSPDIAVRVDAGAASAALQDVTAESLRLDGKTARVRVDADTARATTGIATVRAAAAPLDGKRFTFNVTADIAGAVAQLAGLAIAANQFSNRKYSFTVDADTAGAVASIARLVAMVGALGGLAGVAGGLAGALGGVGAAGVVAGAGLGATLLASAGVGKALTAMSAQQESAGATARQSAKEQQAQAAAVVSAYDRVGEATSRASQARQDSERDITRASQAAQKARSDAARTLEAAETQAERSIATARDQASRSLQTAVTQAAAAKQRESRATRDLRMAQSELTSAWEAGRRSLQDLQDQFDSSRIDQRQAAADMKQARKDLEEARASGDADAIERAQIAYDRQVETIDQLAKRTQRLSVDNQQAQRAGVAGSEEYRSALDKVAAATEQQSDARQASAAAGAAVDQARIDGQRSVQQAEIDGQARIEEARRSGLEQIQAADQRYTDAQEQGRRSIVAADAAVEDAQRALTQALNQTGSAGESAGDKVAAAFANLSPPAAAFARYLFGLQPILDRLSATAAGGLFPPLTAGIDTLLTRLPLIDTVVGQLAAGMGAGLNLVLVTLANPFWAQFFGMLGNAAGTVIPMLFGAIMQLAGAGAILITNLLPLAPAGLGIIVMLADLLGYLSPFLAVLLGGLIPAAGSFLIALRPLGPVLAALQPILLVLAQALSQVLGAVLTALAPILVALTPLIQALATQIATGLVAGIQAATPFLVGLATWLSANPGLVLGVISVLGGLLGALKPLAFVAGFVVSALHGFLIITVVRSLLTSLGLAGTVAGRALLFVLSPLNLVRAAMGFLPRLLPLIGQGLMFLGRALLTAMGPIGWLIMAFGLLYTSSEPFRAAINQLAGSLLPPLMQIVGALVPVVAMLGQTFAGVLGAILGPVVGALGQLISAVLPPLVMILQTVVIPVIQMLAGLFAGVLAFVITRVLVPALQFLIPIITWLAGILSTVLAWVVTSVLVPALNLLVPVFQWIGQAAMWLWTNIIMPVAAGLGIAFAAIGAAASWLWSNVLSPVFGFIGLAARVLMAVIMTVLITPLIIAWNLIAAAATWLYANVLQPTFQAIGAFISWVWTNILLPTFNALVWFWQNVIAPAAMWLYNTIILPIFNLIGAAIQFVWNYIISPALTAMVWYWQNVIAPVISWLYNVIIKPVWDAIGAAIQWVWTQVIQPAFQAVVGGLNWLGDNFTRVTDWIRDIWGRIRGFLAKPINFMIDTVWNGGVVPAWNAVAKLVGLGEIGKLNKIPEARTGGRVDSRGMIHGPGTGTSDSIIGKVIENDAPIKVSRDEMIMNARATRANLPVLTAMNGGSRIGDRGNERRAKVIPGFADGGPVWQGLWNTVHKQFPNARLTDTVRSSGGGYHQKGQAIDVAGSYPMAISQMKDINRWIGTTFPGSTQLIHYPLTGGGINLLNGGPHNYNVATQLGHGNHVHWAQDPANPRGGGNGAQNGWQQISTFFMDKAREAFDKYSNPAIDGMRKFVGPPPPAWKEAVPKLATKARDTVRDFVFGKAKTKDDEASAGAGGGMMGPVGAGAPFVVRQISDSARARGMGAAGAAIGTATGIVESRLTNLASRAVPESLAFPHEGVAPGDHDSVGVFQQRGNGAWGSLASRMNVRSSADMFFNALARFNWRAMDPGVAAQKVQVSAHPDRYGRQMGLARQLVGQHGGPFDAGGDAIGRGFMFKDVIAPERVLDPVETRDGYRPLVAVARQLEADRFQAPSGLSTQQITSIPSSRAEFPTEMRLASGQLELVGDSIVQIINGQLELVESQANAGRRT